MINKQGVPSKKLVLTIDVEWYYNGTKSGKKNIEDFCKKSLKDRIKYDNGQVEKSIDKILAILHKYDQKITFFVLTEIYEAYPRSVEKIHRSGHEIASHSYRHDTLTDIESLKKDLEKNKKFQKKYNITGFRSPRLGLGKASYKLLAKYGYKYDSSAYGTTKFRSSGVNILPVSVLPFRRKAIQNIPSTLNIGLIKKSVPFGSGMFVGLLQKYAKYFINLYHHKHREPPCILIHSWQIEQPHYPFKSFVKNPWMIPYSFECKNVLEYLCKNYELLKVRDYLSQVK